MGTELQLRCAAGSASGKRVASRSRAVAKRLIMTGPEKPNKYRRFRIPENDAGSKHTRLTVYEYIINTLSRQLIATDHNYNFYK